MSWKAIAVVGALLTVGGIVTTLLGAFVLTTDARHHDISPAFGAGIFMTLGGLGALVVSGIGAWMTRGKPPKDGGDAG